MCRTSLSLKLFAGSVLLVGVTLVAASIVTYRALNEYHLR